MWLIEVAAVCVIIWFIGFLFGWWEEKPLENYKKRY
jgi:hypothetical protein